ncbi:MAG: hypothetical protein GY832_03375 [Chloroflexi bacterium]|nr:hypothetical protein [Chloroflexota bacterium]
MTALLNDVAALSTPLLLVLDDYHVIEAQPVHSSYEGAVLTGVTVERDGLFITASGPDASEAFGAAIAEALGE